jgi:hypothetical protein
VLLVVLVAGVVGAVVFFVVEVVPVELVLDVAVLGVVVLEVVVLGVVEGVTLVEPEPLGRACSCLSFKEKVRDRANKSTMIERFFISEKYL